MSLYKSIAATVLTSLIVYMTGCANTSHKYDAWVRVYINQCSNSYYSEPNRVCVTGLARYIHNEQPGEVPVSAIVEGLVHNTTIDANTAGFDNMVNGVAQGLRKDGGATIWIAYKRPNAYGVSFHNYPAQHQFKMYVAASAAGTTSYTVNY